MDVNIASFHLSISSFLKEGIKFQSQIFISSSFKNNFSFLVNDPNAPVDFLTPMSNPTQQTADNPPQEVS